LRPELSVDDAHRERFVREAYVANSLAHPGAVPVIDDDVAEDGCPFLVMDLLVGETLEQRRRRGPLRARARCWRSATPCATCWPGPTRAAWSTATSSPTTSS
jgi:serine/threonine protein kinase